MCLILFISMSFASYLLSSRCLSVLLSSHFDHRHIHYHVYNKHISFRTAYLTPLLHICITVISRRKVFVLFSNAAVIDGEPVSQKSSITSETVHYLFIVTHGRVFRSFQQHIASESVFLSAQLNKEETVEQNHEELIII